VESGWISGGARWDGHDAPLSGRSIPRGWDRHAAGAEIPVSIVCTCAIATAAAASKLPRSIHVYTYIHVQVPPKSLSHRASQPSTVVYLD